MQTQLISNFYLFDPTERIHSLKYEEFTTLGCKDYAEREVVGVPWPKTQFLSLQFSCIIKN